jgi:hypothetical protein
VARRLWWGQAPAPQIASKFGAADLTQLSSIYRIIYLNFPGKRRGACAPRNNRRSMVQSGRSPASGVAEKS